MNHFGQTLFDFDLNETDACFSLLLLPMLNFERIRFEMTRFQLNVDYFFPRWPFESIFSFEFLSIWDNFVYQFTLSFVNWHLNVGNLDYVLSLVSHFDNIPIHFQMAKTYKICDYNRSQYVGVHGGFSQTFVRILNRMNECISIQLKSMKWLHFYDHSFRMEWNGRQYELHVDVQIADFWR